MRAGYYRDDAGFHDKTPSDRAGVYRRGKCHYVGTSALCCPVRRRRGFTQWKRSKPWCGLPSALEQDIDYIKRFKMREYDIPRRYQRHFPCDLYHGA